MDYYPPEWNDEDRISVLLSPMPVDETAKKSRIHFWSTAIHRWSQITNTLSFNLKDVSDAFTKGSIYPKCMKDVICQMMSVGDILEANNLHKCDKRKESWTSWSRRTLVSVPTQWAWQRVKLFVGDDLENAKLVDIKVLKEKCNEIYNHYWKNGKKDDEILTTIPELYQTVGDVVGSIDNLELAVEMLRFEEKLCCQSHNGTLVIKMAVPGSTESPTISQSDLALFDLSRTKADLEERIESIQTELNNLQEEAKLSLKEGRKAKALSNLRRKKINEKSLDKQISILENITSFQMQLQEAKINKKIMVTFKTSVSALKDAMAGDLKGDDVASTMDDIQELLEECNDVSGMISSSVSGGGDGDDDELDQELEDIMNEKLNLSADLPEVPDTLPDILSNDDHIMSPKMKS